MIDKRNLLLIVLGVVAVILIIGLWYLNYYFMVDKADRGTFGDMFGSVNAIFSGLAFAGIIITIYLQGNELSLQRKELVETREVLKRTAEAQEESEKAMIRQAENLKISAKLSALNTLVDHYSKMLDSPQRRKNSTKSFAYFSENLDICIKEIERINELKDIQ